MYTDLHRATRPWFPCVDEFSERHPWWIELTARANLSCVCSGRLVETVLIDDGARQCGARAHPPAITLSVLTACDAQQSAR